MRYFTVLFFILLSVSLFAQKQLVKGVVINESTGYVEPSISVLNLNSLKVSKSGAKGDFQIEANVNDSLHFSGNGFQSIKVKVTNDWVKNESIQIYIRDNATTLDELYISNLNLTGLLQVDTKLIEINDRFFYNSFKPAEYVFSTSTKLNPVDAIYNSFKKSSQNTKKIAELNKETELIELMKTKYDREMVSALLNISKDEIVKVLKQCDQTDRFIYTANDFQILNALNECLQVYNISKK